MSQRYTHTWKELDAGKKKKVACLHGLDGAFRNGNAACCHCPHFSFFQFFFFYTFFWKKKREPMSTRAPVIRVCVTHAHAAADLFLSLSLPLITARLFADANRSIRRKLCDPGEKIRRASSVCPHSSIAN